MCPAPIAAENDMSEIDSKRAPRRPTTARRPGARESAPGKNASHASPDELSHFPLAALRWIRDEDFFGRSQAMLNRAPAPETAVVFVHGWGDSALGTWEAFPAALREMPEAAAADIFFLDYPSTRASVATCAGEAKELLLDLLRAPARHLVNSSLPEGVAARAEEWRYARIVIVAHSMGAVVARRAWLDLERAGLSRQEAEKLRLLFFAPAHLGSSLPDLVASGLGLDCLPGASLVGRALVTYYRSLADLAPGSTALRLLADDSRTARERRMAAGTRDDDLRATVLHARDDKVVVQDRFDEDIDERPIAHRNHRNACKPDEAYRRPVEALRRQL